MPSPWSETESGGGKPPLLPSIVRTYVPLLSDLLLRKIVPLRQTSAEPAPLTHLSALPLQLGVPPLQPSSVNHPTYPLPQILSLPFQLDVPSHQLSALRAAPPPPLSVLLQGRGKPTIIYSTARAHVPLLCDLILRQGVYLCQPSDETAPLPQLSAFFCL